MKQNYFRQLITVALTLCFALFTGVACTEDDCTDCDKPGCIDSDGDGYGAGCDPGDDCNDNDSSIWENCTTGGCVDADGDGYGVGCSIGVDCNDRNPEVWNDCEFDDCIDADGDGYGVGCAIGADCNDADATVWANCPIVECVDFDGDGYGEGCAAGTDCDDLPDTGTDCNSGCSTFYLDADADGRGDLNAPRIACAAPFGYTADGTDCAPADYRHYNDCGSCVDADDDGYGAGCDLGPDCDDAELWGVICHDGCTTYYTDTDADGYGDYPVDACQKLAGYLDSGDDCAPADPLHHSDCGLCVDADGDDHGADCDPGPDCDDDAATGVGCDSGCLTYYDDIDADGFGDDQTAIDACISPGASYIKTGGDCSPSEPEHWSDCGACTDADADSYGAGCDLGADCDDTAETGGGCITDCTTFYNDSDGDSYGNPNGAEDFCSQPSGWVADNTDCAPVHPWHWSDCGLCQDWDTDGYGPDCNLGTDCDDDASTGGGCQTGCTNYYPDADSDGFGDPAGGSSRCTAPTGYVNNPDDCDPASGVTYPDAATLEAAGLCTKDFDGDGYGDINPPAGVDPGADCRDNQSYTFPGAAELDGPECRKDYDDDGYGDDSAAAPIVAGNDCDDNSVTTYPGAAELDDPAACMKDADGDGYGDKSTSGSDCRDDNAGIHLCSFSAYTKVNDLPPYGFITNGLDHIDIAADGSKWFGNESRLIRLDDNSTPLDTADDVWSNYFFTPSNIEEISLVDNDRVWVITATTSATSFGASYLDTAGTPANYADDQTTSYYPTGVTDYTYAWAIEHDFNGVWSGFKTLGLYYLDNGLSPADPSDDQSVFITSPAELVTMHINDIVADPAGGLWLALSDYSGGGALVFYDYNNTPLDDSDDAYALFDELDGMPVGEVHEIAIDSAGGIWLAHQVGAVYLDWGLDPLDKTDDTFITFDYRDVPGHPLRSINIGGDGAIWFACYMGGAVYFDNGGTPTDKADDYWALFNYDDGLSDYTNQVGDVAVDSSGAAWIASMAGVDRLALE